MTGPCVASDWNGEEELFYVTKNTSGILVLPDRGRGAALYPLLRLRECMSGRVGSLSD